MTLNQTTIKKSQYIYINSAHRDPSDKSYDFEIVLSDGMLRCGENEYLSLTCSHMNIKKDWYFVNDTNNILVVKQPNGQQTLYTIPVRNYVHRRLAIAITALTQNAIQMTYDQNTNKFVFSMGDDWAFDFTVPNSCWYLLGFNKNTIVSKQPGTQLTSTNILNIYLSKNIIVNVTNLTPMNYSAIENTVAMDAEVIPSNTILCLSNDFAPYTTLTHTSSDRKYSLDVKQKQIHKIRLQVTDENKDPLIFITDYTIVLRVDTFAFEDISIQEKTLNALESIEQYQRMKFVASSLY